MILERFDPYRWAPSFTRLQHVARYEWAKQFADCDFILDVACGVGYGTYMLTVDSNCVASLGIDVDSEAISIANCRYREKRLTFQVGDACNLLITSQSVALVVSFETIEHLKDDSKFLLGVSRALETEGTFICSTPNRRLYNPLKELNDLPYNPNHLREYTQADFGNLLSQYFLSVEIFHQCCFSLRYLRLIEYIAAYSSGGAQWLHRLIKNLRSYWMSPEWYRPSPHVLSEGDVFVALCRRPRKL